MIQAFAFYLFAAVVCLSGLLTITARNPVHSVLWLILAFFSSAGLFVLLGAEFLAMLLVVVYVGAVAVLFLFVVMMLDIDFAELRAGFVRYAALGLLLAVALVAEILIGVGAWSAGGIDLARRAAPTSNTAMATRSIRVAATSIAPTSHSIRPCSRPSSVYSWFITSRPRLLLLASGVVPLAAVPALPLVPAPPTLPWAEAPFATASLAFVEALVIFCEYLPFVCLSTTAPALSM